MYRLSFGLGSLGSFQPSSPHSLLPLSFSLPLTFPLRFFLALLSLIAFDTPFLGLHPSVFKHTFTKATTHVTQAKEVAASLSILAPAFLAYTFGSKSKTTNTNTATTPSPGGTAAATAISPSATVDTEPVREYFDPFGTGGVESGGDTHFTHEPPTAAEAERRRSSGGGGVDAKEAARRGSASGQPTPKMVPAGGGSAWSRFSTPALFGLGTAAVAAAAAGAYVKRNDVGLGLNWAQVSCRVFVFGGEFGRKRREEESTRANLFFASCFFLLLQDHLRFIGNLWDGEQMKARLEGIEGMVENEGIIFRK